MIYDLTSPVIAAALIAAYRRGMLMLIVADYVRALDLDSQVRNLVREGLMVKLDKRSGFYHHKDLTIDGQHAYVGSFNWTSNAENRNNETLVCLPNNPTIARAIEVQGECEAARAPLAMLSPDGYTLRADGDPDTTNN